MRILALFLIFFCFALSAKSTNLDSGMKPTHYRKRTQAVLNIGLAYYGRYWNRDDLIRIAPMLKERFARATKDKIQLNILGLEVLDYKYNYDPEFMAKKYPHIKDPERLQRIFYYETVNAKVMKEAYEEFKKTNLGKRYKVLDALLVITGAQFEGLGFANGRVAVTEQPREIAWAIPSGRTEVVSDESIVDELIHELGHTIFLGHTSTQCQKPHMTLEEKRACCESSPSKYDVMSYCRARGSVGPDQMFGFEECNLKMIDDLVIPAMLKGRKWNVSGRKRCL